MADQPGMSGAGGALACHQEAYGPLTLRVVTHAAWLAADMTRGAPRGVSVVHDLGLDAPVDSRRTAWWMPHRTAARLAVTPGVILPELTSAGPEWTALLDRRWLHRRVWAGPLARMGACDIWSDGAAFAKPAEVKLARAPAIVYPTAAVFADAARASGMTDESWVVVSDPVQFDAEFRCFVRRDGEGRHRVVASSPYLVNGTTWDSWESLVDAPDAGEAAAFADSLLASGVAGPRGWVLDVGLISGEWAVVEANAAWSSNPYHCDVQGVVASVLASQAGGDGGFWRWRSDPAVTSRALPLPVRLG